MRDGRSSSFFPSRDVEGDRATPPILPLGARFARGEVVRARSGDEFVLRSPDGEELTVGVCPHEAAQLEEDASRALADHPAFPRVVERGDHPVYGSYVVLSPPPSDSARLGDAARTMPLSRALALLDEAMDLAAAVERAGFDWAPDPGDAWVRADGSLAFSRVRVADRLRDGERLDARAVLEALGAPFLPEPLAFASPDLVRLMVAHVGVSDDAWTIERAREPIANAVAGDIGEDDVGGVSDVGLLRARNEDAVAIARGDGWTVLVVCDGVAASSRADRASRTAADTACRALADFAGAGALDESSARAAMRAAIRDANHAVCAIEAADGGDEPPGTTIVAALVQGSFATIGWVGDSRAYAIADASAPRSDALLTRDHSWANEAAGERSAVDLARDPLAHALTRCLGVSEAEDAPPIAADIVERALDEGALVLATDGFWNHYPDARDLGTLVRSAPRRGAPALARWLVNHALALGGQDNVTVAVARTIPKR